MEGIFVADECEIGADIQEPWKLNIVILVEVIKPFVRYINLTQDTQQYYNTDPKQWNNSSKPWAFSVCALQ